MFDGDGYVCGVRIKDGVASCSAAWVRTLRWRTEDAARAATVMKLGDMHGLSGFALATLYDAKKKLSGASSRPPSLMGTANTALEVHAGRLLALNEGDIPWQIRVLCDGALETLGACTFDGALASRTFTAHPKADAATGELLWLGYAVHGEPLLTFGVLDAKGNAAHTTAVPLRFPQMVHDFAITDSFALFWDLPLVFDAKVRGAAAACVHRQTTSPDTRLPPCHAHTAHGDGGPAAVCVRRVARLALRPAASPR